MNSLIVINGIILIGLGYIIYSLISTDSSNLSDTEQFSQSREGSEQAG